MDFRYKYIDMWIDFSSLSGGSGPSGLCLNCYAYRRDQSIMKSPHAPTLFNITYSNPRKNKQIDRQTCRLSDGRTGRYTDRLTNRHTGMQIDRQTDRHADTQTG